MYCLKCGNEAENDQIFCAHCLNIMEQYPVKPGTNIQLPRRNTLQTQKKQTWRRNFSLEEQVVHMRVTIRTLVAILGVVLIALGISIWLNFLPRATQAQPPETSIGQNYSAGPAADD